jgi:hypothetical protein
MSTERRIYGPRIDPDHPVIGRVLVDRDPLPPGPRSDDQLADRPSEAFNAAANKASFPINKPSCSSEGAITAPVTISNGTGLYPGITGKGRITLTLVWILSSPGSGKCDGNNVLSHSQYLNGSGTVSFS